MKVLLVDDSKTVCAIYSGLLTEQGYTVLVAHSMEEALQLAIEHHPPLAIVDYFMPEGNGDDLTRALHEHPETASTVVAIHSQYHDVVEKALSAGAIELIGKDDPQDLFLMRVAALRTMVEAQTYQRNVEQLLNKRVDEDHPVSVLLVDDSPTVRAVYGAHLRNAGFEVHEAGSIAEGRAMAHNVQPDLMLVDFILPDGHGDQLVRKLLSQADTATILMVMFSNKEDLEDAALGAGAIDIMSKDDPAELFMRRIHSMRRYVIAQRKQRQLMQESREEVRKLLDEAERAKQSADEAKQSADEANSAKDDFLASMSHELRTPLTSIIGNSEYLLDQEGWAVGEQRKVLRDIESAGRVQLALVNDILDMSKIYSGKFTIDNSPYDLSALLAGVERMLATRARDAGNSLIVAERRAQVAWLMGDAQRIAQILINLLTNAIKFTRGGEVALTAWSDSDSLFFEIRDNGIGMSQETLDRLFKPFEQADSSISKRFGGTGLGLFISYGLAELMNGTIRVESVEGEGSTFTLRLPYVVTAKPVRQGGEVGRSDSSNGAVQLSGEVLVAEDTPELQLLEKRLLESMGVTVTLANNGVEAVALARTTHYDLILMDMQMPEMDGIEATRTLRAEENRIPIVPLTANVMQKHRDLFAELGCEDFLGKPIDKREMCAVLQKYLNPQQAAPVALEVDDELMAIFRESSATNRRNLQTALSQTDWEQIKETAHTIKGSAASFGFPQLSQIAGELQQAVESEQTEQARGLTQQLLQQLDGMGG